MEIINRKLSLHKFKSYVSTYDFGPKPPNKLVVHHTWRPTKNGWDGQRTIMGLKRYYEGKNWPTGPHLFVAEDGIWLFSPMRHNGIHAGQLNHLSVGIEVVGDYDNEKWSGETKYHAIGTISLLSERLNIPQSGMYFHRDVSGKSCPGWAITKEWLFTELEAFKMRPRIPTPSEFHRLAEVISAPLPAAPSTERSREDTVASVAVPGWAQESVDFVIKNGLFEIQNENDIRDAVKFHRLYQLIEKEYG